MQPLFYLPPAVTRRAVKSGVTVRPVDIAMDVRGLARINYSAFFDKYSLLCLNRCFFERWRIELWTQLVYSQLYGRCCTAKLARCAVACDESGEIVGIMQLAYPFDVGDLTLGLAKYSGSKCACASEVYIERLAVAPHARGSGVGKALLDWAAEYARAQGRSLLTLAVMWTNPAIHLYRREGFAVDRCETFGPQNFAQSPGVFTMCGQRYCFLIHMSKRLPPRDGDHAARAAEAVVPPEPERMERAS